MKRPSLETALVPNSPDDAGHAAASKFDFYARQHEDALQASSQLERPPVVRVTDAHDDCSEHCILLV